MGDVPNDAEPKEFCAPKDPNEVGGPEKPENPEKPPENGPKLVGERWEFLSYEFERLLETGTPNSTFSSIGDKETLLSKLWVFLWVFFFLP